MGKGSEEGPLQGLASQDKATVVVVGCREPSQVWPVPGSLWASISP